MYGWLWRTAPRADPGADRPAHCELADEYRPDAADQQAEAQVNDE